MANSANPEINKKIATSALGTLVIATVFFYLGDRYAETLVTYPGQIFVRPFERCIPFHVADHKGCTVCPRYDQ